MISNENFGTPSNVPKTGHYAEKELIPAALETLNTHLARVLGLHVSPNLEFKTSLANAFWLDALLTVELAGETWELCLEVKDPAPPRVVRDVASRLRIYTANRTPRSYPVLAAPWLSLQSRAICEEAGVGYLDLAGNCRLSFGTVYIERTGFIAPKAEKRELNSLFGPKSARLLRVFLADLSRSLKITEMAQLAEVSLGQASNVRKALLAQNWAVEAPGSVRLVEPRRLLEAWAKAYRPPKHRRYLLYTLLHGSGLEEALRQVMIQTKSPAAPHGRLALASHSAAQYWSPYLRNSTTHLYALDLEPVLTGLQARRIDQGGNVIVDVL